LHDQEFRIQHCLQKLIGALVRAWRLTWFWTVYKALCNFLAVECAAAPPHALRDISLHALILSLVISSSASIVLLLCRKSVKCQHPWHKATSSLLLCLAVSCRILAQVLLALLQFGSRYCAAAFSLQVLSSRTDLDLALLYIYGISYSYGQYDVSALLSLPAAMLERWSGPQVCRIKITFESSVPDSQFVSKSESDEILCKLDSTEF